ncbi:MAG: sugar-binding protein [Anaerolineales bacterium]
MKKINKTKILFSLAILIIIGLACNFTNPVAPTPILFPTVDFTLTAIFGTVYPLTTPTIPSLIFISPTSTSPSSNEINTPTNSVTATMTPIPPSETALPTQTPKPTKTKEKPVSYVGPDRHNAYPVYAAHLDTPPTIDGVFDDWDSEKYDVGYVVYGADNWSGVKDCSATFMIGWDKHALYIAVKVKDDQYQQNASGENIYKGDSLEILLDQYVSADFYLTTLSNDDYQLGISPGNPNPGVNPEAYLWFPQGIEGNRSEVKIASVPTADGYRVELKIPWSIFNITPSAGDIYGFVFSVSDNDNPSKNVQQSMVSNVKTRVLVNPITWGDLHLEK